MIRHYIADKPTLDKIAKAVGIHDEDPLVADKPTLDKVAEVLGITTETPVVADKSTLDRIATAVGVYGVHDEINLVADKETLDRIEATVNRIEIKFDSVIKYSTCGNITNRDSNEPTYGLE